jgi:hypothetical protein
VKVILTLSLLFCALAHGEMPIPETAELPGWVTGMIDFLLGVPTIGPIVYNILAYIGVASGVMTGIASLFWFTCKALEKAALLAGFMPIANKVRDIYEMLYPYLAFFSVYNAPKVKLPFRKKL